MLTRILDKCFKHKTIVNCEREEYLKRWYLFRRQKIAFFLHRFHHSDEERALHDHPWSFITIILWRGYVEHTDRPCPRCVVGGYHAFAGECVQCDGKRRVPVVKRIWPGMICFRPAEWRHRVALVKNKPAWTLMIRFKERREWGFWMPTGWVQWNKWWQNNCE